jgi:hypothetical protein
MIFNYNHYGLYRSEKKTGVQHLNLGMLKTLAPMLNIKKPTEIFEPDVAVMNSITHIKSKAIKSTKRNTMIPSVYVEYETDILNSRKHPIPDVGVQYIKRVSTPVFRVRFHSEYKKSNTRNK